MKIGIMSMQRIKNYGSFLQAYGLKTVLEELGYTSVEFLDYKIGQSILKHKKEKMINRIFRKIINIFMYKERVKRNQVIAEFNQRYDNEFLPMLNITKEKNYNHNIDCLIIGSDEVFNCIQSNPDVGYSKELFGQGFDNCKIISYAACFGGTNTKKLKEYGVDEEISNLLKKFTEISVRDKNSYITVKDLTNIEPVLNLDPVLIANFDNLIDENVVKHNNYVIVYAYTDRIQKEESDTIIKFAKKHNKKIISIGTYQKCADIHLVLNPFEMLAYIKCADYIITDTFHGAIFSIKYNKKFVTIIRESNKEKLGDLLDRLKLEKRAIEKIEDMEKILLEEVNYNTTNDIIEEEKKKARQYLKLIGD